MPIGLGIIVLVLAFSVFDGVRHGVIRRAVEVVGLVAVFLFASRLADVIEPALSDGFDMSPNVAFFVSWIVVIAGGVIGVRLLAVALSKLFRVSIIGWLDRLGGGILGLVFGAIVASCILIGVLALPIPDRYKRDVRDQPVSAAVLHIAPSLYDVVAKTWDGESFFEMLEDRLGPMAEDAVEGIKAYMSDRPKEDESEN